MSKFEGLVEMDARTVINSAQHAIHKIENYREKIMEQYITKFQEESKKPSFFVRLCGTKELPAISREDAIKKIEHNGGGFMESSLATQISWFYMDTEEDLNKLILAAKQAYNGKMYVPVSLVAFMNKEI